MQRIYYFLNIRKYIKDRIRKYDLYNRNKSVWYKLYGLLKSLEALKDVWKYIIFDFIIKLPPSVKLIIKVVFDLILVVINRFTKYGYFILYKESLLVEKLVYTFNKYIIGNYEISKEIISERDKLFTSRF
jgi:hypothetical protein